VIGVEAGSEIVARIDEATRRRRIRDDEWAAKLAAFRLAGARENRCRECHKVMGEFLATDMQYINRCPRCGAWNELTATTEPKAP
jgi:phage FluMu protein Com